MADAPDVVTSVWPTLHRFFPEFQQDKYMRVAIFGHKGWIGQQVTHVLREDNRFELIDMPDDLRADDSAGVRAFLDKDRPDRVVSVLGRTHGPGSSTIDYLEGGRDKLVLNLRDNLYAPLTLALACQERGIHFAYLGTGCIFEYDDRHPLGFTECDDPNFFGSSYSVVKGFTDRIFRQLPILQVRIRMPITAQDHPRNFITKIASYERVCSIENSMTVLPTLLPLFVELIAEAARGTFNLVNPGIISHNRILQLYRDMVDPGFTWANFSVEDQDRVLAAHRSNNMLSTAKLQERFPDVPNIETAVSTCLSRWATSRATENTVKK